MELPDENLPGIDYSKLQSMNGVNDRMDQLIASGMSPEEAAQAIQGMGAELPSGGRQGLEAGAPATPAEPSLKPTGAQMDLSFIQALNNAPDDETFNSMVQQLDPVQRHIYDRAYGYKQVTPAWAAQQAESFYKMQDEAAKAEKTPQAKALQIAQAEKAQKTAEMANDIVSLMDRLRGYKKGETGSEKKTPKYFGRVGTFDSFMPAGSSGDRAGGYIDHDTLESTLALAEAQANRGQGNFTETERAMLRSAATGGLNYRRDDKSYAQIFESMYDMFKKKAEQQQTLSASAPSSMPSFSVGQTLTDKFGNVRIYRGTDQSGRPILDPVQ